MTHSVIDKVRGQGLVYFDSMEAAESVLTQMKGCSISGVKLQVSDY